MRVLVTGATGFVGKRIIAVLLEKGIVARAAVRRPDDCVNGVEIAVTGDVGPETDWAKALDGVDAVIHAAARVHVMRDRAPDPLAAHRHVNTLGTQALARACIRADVGRLVFLSSVKVMGEATTDRPWSEADQPAPSDAYGRSKWEGEQLIAEAAQGSRFRYASLRSPLVYGPGVKGNFLALLKLCATPVPLPLGAVTNRRSLVFVDTLADAAVRAATGPGIPNGPYFISDGEPVSTPALIRSIRSALGQPARLVPVPSAWFVSAARLAGQSAQAQRLLGNLDVDDSRFRAASNWRPSIEMEEGIAHTVRWYRECRV